MKLTDDARLESFRYYVVVVLHKRRCSVWVPQHHRNEPDDGTCETAGPWRFWKLLRQLDTAAASDTEEVATDHGPWIDIWTLRR